MALALELTPEETQALVNASAEVITAQKAHNAAKATFIKLETEATTKYKPGGRGGHLSEDYKYVIG